MRTRNRALIKKTMKSIEKAGNENCHDDNHLDDVAEIGLFHVGLMLPLAGGRASQSYPLSEI